MKKTVLSMIAIVFVFILIGSCLGVSAATTYTFGVKNPADAIYETTPPAPLGAQGNNNFYFYYAVENNVSAKVNLANIKECEYGVVNRSGYGNMAKKFMQPQLADVDNYFNSVSPANYPGENPQIWFRVDSYGYSAPSGHMTPVIYFKAPEAGEYTLDVEYFAGAQGPYVSDNADGVYLGIFNKTTSTPLFTKDIKKTDGTLDGDNPVPIAIPQKKLTLAKDDKIYFIADPKKTFSNDMAHWYIKFNMTAAATAPPASSVASVSEVSSSSSSELISESISVSESATVSDSSSESSSTAATTGARGPWIYYVIAGVVVLLGGGAAAYYFIFVKAKK